MEKTKSLRNEVRRRSTWSSSEWLRDNSLKGIREPQTQGWLGNFAWANLVRGRSGLIILSGHREGVFTTRDAGGMYSSAVSEPNNDMRSSQMSSYTKSADRAVRGGSYVLRGTVPTSSGRFEGPTRVWGNSGGMNTTREVGSRGSRAAGGGWCINRGCTVRAVLLDCRVVLLFSEQEKGQRGVPSRLLPSP